MATVFAVKAHLNCCLRMAVTVHSFVCMTDQLRQELRKRNVC